MQGYEDPLNPLVDSKIMVAQELEDLKYMKGKAREEYKKLSLEVNAELCFFFNCIFFCFLTEQNTQQQAHDGK